LPTKPLTKQPTGEAEGVELEDWDTEREAVGEGVEDRLLPALAVTEGVGVGEALGQMILLMMWLLESAT